MTADPHRARRLAVIPARGGSRRVPGKNIRELLGRPAIAYTIDAALECALFERVIVTTDSESIAEVALRCGADVPFLRPAALADDQTPVSAATADALDRVGGSAFEHVAQLMPNCPLRTGDDLRASYDRFVESGSVSQISVARFGFQTPWWAVQLDADHRMVPVFPDRITARSQDLPALFCPTGAVWWARAATLIQARTFHVAERTGWEIPWQRAIDIDTEEDWHLAEQLMRRTQTPEAVGVR